MIFGTLPGGAPVELFELSSDKLTVRISNYGGRIISVVKDLSLIHISPLYQEIYQKGSRCYWEKLDAAIRQMAEKRGLPDLRNDDSMHRPFNEPPVIVNYFYHEQIKRSAMKKKEYA